MPNCVRSLRVGLGGGEFERSGAVEYVGSLSLPGHPSRLLFLRKTLLPCESTAVTGTQGETGVSGVDDVRDLEEPPAFKKDVKKWLTAIEDVVEEMQDDASILNTADPFKKANKRAKKLGLKGCV